jgi:hypothetical protein
MLAELDADPNLVAMSTDYSPDIPNWQNPYDGRVFSLKERWHTWFCIYKREALKCQVSHWQHKESDPNTGELNVWDSTGFFQKALREDYGYELKAIDRKYQPCFLHYGAFSKNKDINESNIQLFRRLHILGKKGLFGQRDLLIGSFDKAVRLLARQGIRLRFGQAKKNMLKNVPGWGVPTNEPVTQRSE